MRGAISDPLEGDTEVETVTGVATAAAHVAVTTMEETATGIARAGAEGTVTVMGGPGEVIRAFLAL